MNTSGYVSRNDDEIGCELSRFQEINERRGELGRRLLQESVEHRDFANFANRAWSQMPLDYDRQQALQNIRGLNERLEAEYSAISGIIYASGTAVAFASTVTGLMSPFGVSTGVLPQERREEFSQLQEEFRQFSWRNDNRQYVIKFIQSLGLDGYEQGRLVIQHLNTAWEEHGSQLSWQGSSSLPALMSLREAIDNTIALLIKLRPQQEPLKSTDKVIKLLTQVGENWIPGEHMQQLQADYNKIHGELSSSKQKTWDRGSERALLVKGTELLNEILSAVDRSRLRNSANHRGSSNP